MEYLKLVKSLSAFQVASYRLQVGLNSVDEATYNL